MKKRQCLFNFWGHHFLVDLLPQYRRCLVPPPHISVPSSQAWYMSVVRVHLDGRGGGVHGRVHPLHHARAHRRYRLDPRLQLQQVKQSRQPRQPRRGEMGGREWEL